MAGRTGGWSALSLRLASHQSHAPQPDHGSSAGPGLGTTLDPGGERFAGPSGRVMAGFEVLFLHGWAPHASQPKPLKPGSAALRLSEALGTAEYSAGEKVERS